MAATTGKASSKAPTRKEPPYVQMTLKGHENDVDSITFIAGTRLLVTVAQDKTLRVWDLDTGKQVGEPLLGHDDGICSVAGSPDGRWIVSGSRNGRILVWEVATNKRELRRVPISFKGAALSLIFAPDSETFASTTWDSTVCVWKRETGKMILGPLEVGSHAFSVSYSPDGKKLVAGTQAHIIVWNAETGKELLKIEQGAYRVAFTPDGLHLISLDGDIRISDTITGDTIKQFDPHTDDIYSLSIAPNGTKFATTSRDKTVPLTESEKDSQQSTQTILKKTIPSTQPRPRRAPIPTSEFFRDFDPGRNDRAATTTRHAEGSRIKNMMNRLFSRSSSPQGHTPRPPNIPLVDVSATRGKYRTANAHSGKRHLPRPVQPRRKAHAGASSSSTAAAGTSNVMSGSTSGPLQTGNTNNSSATNRPPSPPGVEHVPHTSCFAVLARYFPRLSRTRQTRPSASGSP
ncbi:WD40-repeat-containing domain protein [Suillus subaureus]|uniref:WD40-repeat-containing domain protein n=1 Tax=Suillus subaureus TaxID=48587 RepID=A0A9P7EPA8_9AGAM|nr:WD40-repeat-containing domain protein [Suillus subaureus]KAG1827481.1 WD40-repeat-containing domain protein [Suillus subaureus]